jgi:preprotein translocase subunit SecY
MERAQRRILIQYPKRQVSATRMTGGESSHLPLKLNTSGVIPPIFASSLLLLPTTAASFSASGGTGWLATISAFIAHGRPLYMVLYVALIIFFTYFYTAIQFDPEKQAEMIQRQGGFVPGVRPGRQTAKHLSFILNRITLPGSIFLAVIAILPAIAGAVWGVNIAFSGVSILIVVGVALETMKQIESQLTMRNYEGILT